jgi:2-ketoarginine methyltransferase
MNGQTTFLSGLNRSLNYVRGYVTSQLVFDLLQEGMFDRLARPSTASHLAAEKRYDPDLLDAVFDYLVQEDVLTRQNGNGHPKYVLTAYGRDIQKHAGWFNMLIGGYGPIFSNVVNMLKHGVGYASRVGKWVGVGSCQISNYDAIPLSKELIRATKPGARHFVDFGCGNALYLCQFCKEMKGARAVGIEPDRAAYEAGLALVKKEKLQKKITLVNCPALDYDIQEPPDFIMFNFVLHELCGQVGEKRTVQFLRGMGRKFRESYLLVIEVNRTPDDPSVLKTPVGLGYYNPYFLLHPFTRQKLLSEEKWRELFAKAGFEIIARKVVDPKVDPTGLEIGYVLKYTR